MRDSHRQVRVPLLLRASPLLPGLRKHHPMLQLRIGTHKCLYNIHCGVHVLSAAYFDPVYTVNFGSTVAKSVKVLFSLTSFVGLYCKMVYQWSTSSSQDPLFLRLSPLSLLSQVCSYRFDSGDAFSPGALPLLSSDYHLFLCIHVCNLHLRKGRL